MVVNREPTRSDTGERGLWTCGRESSLERRPRHRRARDHTLTREPRNQCPRDSASLTSTFTTTIALLW